MKKIRLILSVLLIVSFVMAYVPVSALGTVPPSYSYQQLTGSRPSDGTVLLDYSLTSDLGLKPFAWDSGYTNFVYSNGCYKFSKISGSDSYFFSPTGKVFDVKPNRNYLVSALVYCDFDRVNSEVTLGLRVGAGTEGITDSDRQGERPITLVDGFHGLPADTNGQWLRFETITTTPPDAKKGRFYGKWNGFADESEVFCIADMEVIELPEEELTALDVGEGLAFGGSSGMYNMKVQAPVVTDSTITVTTNGAEYIFNKSTSEVTINQLIGNKRTLAVLKPDKSLSSLYLYGSPSDKEAILTTGSSGLSFGVQMDGMLLISTHGSDLNITVTSEIEGQWNRLLSGNLVAMDDTGGFTVNPAIPLGTGRTARYTAVSGVDFEKDRGDTTFVSNAYSGWSAKWTISSGERLGVSAFPSREYDWKNSFDSAIANINFSSDTSSWQTYKNTINLRYGVLWSAFQGAWGMSHGTQYIPKDETKFKAHISAANAAGVEPLEYMSMYFWDGTLDEYITEVTRHRDTYGITGVYTDGVPPIDWLKAYEGMRRLREVFPNGCIVAHTTGQTANGGAPLATPEVFIPAIDSYATFTLRGESVVGTSQDWLYPRYVTSGYGTSNVFGLQKYDGWKINDVVISDAEQQLLHLLHNGRARYDGTYSSGYKNILAKVKKQWTANGWSDGYYYSSYLPYVRRLVRDEHAKLVSSGTAQGYPATDIVTEDFAAACEWTQNGNTAVIENGSLKLLNTVSKGDFLPCYGKTDISFKLNLSAQSKGRIDIKDAKGTTAVSLLQTGNKLRYLNRKGGYALLDDVSENTFVTVSMSLDPATGKYDLFIDGEKVLTQKPFHKRASELSVVEFSNTGSSAVYVDDLTVKCGL